MLRSVLILLLSIPLWLTAQKPTEPEEKNHAGFAGAANFKDIYLKLADTFYGGFGADTQCTIIKYIISGARTQGNIQHHLLQGRSWHLGNENKFTIRPKINSIGTSSVEECIDSMYTTPEANRQLDSLVKNGWKIQFAEGEYELIEDSTGRFSGKAAGIFKIQFLYHPVLNAVASIPRSIMLQEPAVIFTGLWNPKSKNDLNIPLFFSSLIPFITKDKQILLPDFRIRPDGSVFPENWINLKTKPVGLPK